MMGDENIFERIFSDLVGFIVGAIGMVLVYAFLMWVWGGMWLANLVGPLFLMLDLPLPDWFLLRVAMISLPLLPFVALYAVEWIAYAFRTSKFMSLMSFLFLAFSVIINLWIVFAPFSITIRDALLENVPREERVEFFKWRATDYWVSDKRGDKYGMRWINRELILLGSDPLGTHPKWDRLNPFGNEDMSHVKPIYQP